MIAPARVAAYNALLAVSARRADLPSAVASARSTLVDERDRSLVTDIATGVQRQRALLDHLIGVFSKRPVERLDPEVVEVLRLSAYQLLRHGRVPASAVVDDAVKLARRAGKRSAAGFVNALLRTISRQRDRLPIPPRPTAFDDRAAVLDYLSITLSHPRWLVARWYDRLGFEATEAWLHFNNAPAPLTLRANPLRLKGDNLASRLAHAGIVVRSARFAPDGFIVEAGQHAAAAGLEAGSFVVQDEASQLVALLAGDRPGRLVLDTCASPGGKTTALAAAMRNEGMLIACDVRNRRMELLRRTVGTTGATNVRLVQADLRVPLPFTRRFDCVLVDAPCSGLGVLRTDPDIRWRREERDLISLSTAQQKMLDHAADAVAPGGRLVYATCSSEPEENEVVAAAFLGGHQEFVAVDARDASEALPAALVDQQGHLRTLPHLHGLDAFFGAVFRRRGVEPLN
jgi:16S rRNA (cytosine967-C5)-methyltransferase